MESLIRQYDGWQTATAQQLLAFFQEEVTITASEYRLNANDLQDKLGVATANAFALAIKDSMPLTIQGLGNDKGTDFANSKTIETLEALASSYPQFSSVISTILGWVRQSKTRWAWTYDSSQLPNTNQIQSVLESMLVVDWCERAIEKLAAPLRNGKTIEELKAAIAELI